MSDEVLRYLMRHERAHDTLEGIVAWWLPMRRIEHTINEIEAAMRQLVANGFVMERRTSDGGIHYYVDPSADQAIRRHLEMKTSRSRKRAEPPSRARKKN